MKKLYPVVALCALSLLLFGQSQSEQAKNNDKAAPPDSGDKNRITLDVSRVNMLYTVSDKKGRFVTDLTKDDFEVFESKKPQTIIEFAAETDLPLRLAILIDTSNSIRDRFHFQQEAATAFIDGTVRPEHDKAMIVSFDTAAELVADLTDNIGDLEKAVENLRPGGGTSLYDAIFFACRDKLMEDQPLYKFRRAMVILSDGEDNQSRYTRDQALEMAQKADVNIYTISTNITRIETDGDKVMRYFAAETGGQAFFPFKASDLSQIVREHRQRAAAPVQHLLSPRAAESGRPLSSGGDPREGAQRSDRARSQRVLRSEIVSARLLQ